MSQTVPAALLFPQIASLFPVVDVIGASYSLTGDDAGRWIRTASAAPVTITLTADPAADFAAWSMLIIQKGGAGNVTLAAAPGVTIETAGPLVLTQQFSRFELKRTAVNVWTATIVGASVAGADRFTSLLDVPGSYIAQAAKIVRVRADELGLEFRDMALDFVSKLLAADQTMAGPLQTDLLVPGVAVASAATTDLGASPAMKQNVTGTAVITSFGVKPNRLRFLVFAASCTITYNAVSLITPGAANIVTAAGDTAIVTSDSAGNWRVREYTRAADGVDFVKRPGDTMTGLLGLTQGAAGTGLRFGASGPNWASDADTALRLFTSGNERVAFLAGVVAFAGGVLASGLSIGAVTPRVQQVGTSNSTSSYLLWRFAGGGAGPTIYVGGTRAASQGLFAAAQSGDAMGQFASLSDDGVQMVSGGDMTFFAEAAWSATVRSTFWALRLRNAAGAITSRLRVSSLGEVQDGSANTMISQQRAFRLRVATLATLIGLSGNADGDMYKASDAGGGNGLVIYDGTTFRRSSESGTARRATDASFALTPIASSPEQFCEGALTADRSITLVTTNVYDGCRFRIVCTHTSVGGPWKYTVAYTRNGVAATKNILTDTWAEFVYDGTNAVWKLAASGPL